MGIRDDLMKSLPLPIDHPEIIQKVDEVRKQFLEIVQSDVTAFDPIDVELVKNVDFQVRRFIYSNDLDKAKALKNLVEGE